MTHFPLALLHVLYLQTFRQLWLTSFRPPPLISFLLPTLLSLCYFTRIPSFYSLGAGKSKDLENEMWNKTDACPKFIYIFSCIFSFLYNYKETKSSTSLDLTFGKGEHQTRPFFSTNLANFYQKLVNFYQKLRLAVKGENTGSEIGESLIFTTGREKKGKVTYISIC